MSVIQRLEQRSQVSPRPTCRTNTAAAPLDRGLIHATHQAKRARVSKAIPIADRPNSTPTSTRLSSTRFIHHASCTMDKTLYVMPRQAQVFRGEMSANCGCQPGSGKKAKSSSPRRIRESISSHSNTSLRIRRHFCEARQSITVVSHDRLQGQDLTRRAVGADV